MIGLLVRNASINIITEITTSVFGIVLFMVAGRILGPERIGIFSLAMTLGVLWGQLPNFGFDKLVARDIGREHSQAAYYFSYITTTKVYLMLIAMVGVVITCFAMGYEPLKRNVVLILSFTAFLQTFMVYFNSYFRAFQRAEYEAYIRIIMRTGNMILGVSVLYAGFGLIGFSLSQTFMAFIAIFMGLFFLKRKFIKLSLRWNITESKKFLINSFPFVLLSVLVMLYVSIGILILNIFKGDYATGIFSAAGKLAQVMLFFPTAVTAAFLPIMSKLHSNRGDYESDLFDRIYGYAFKYMAIIGIAIAAGFSVLSEPICVFLYGTKFIESGVALRILGWAMAISFLNTVMANTIIAVGKEKLLLYISVGAVLLNVLFNLWAVPRYSYAGAAFANVITESAVIISQYIIIKPYLGPKFSYLRLVYKAILATMGMSVIVYVTSYYLHLHILISVFVGVAVYTVFLFLFKSFEPQEIKLVRDIISHKAEMDFPKA